MVHENNFSVLQTVGYEYRPLLCVCKFFILKYIYIFYENYFIRGPQENVNQLNLHLRNRQKYAVLYWFFDRPFDPIATLNVGLFYPCFPRFSLFSF